MQTSFNAILGGLFGPLFVLGDKTTPSDLNFWLRKISHKIL